MVTNEKAKQHLNYDLQSVRGINTKNFMSAATPPRYEFGIASLSNKKELLQVDDPVTFQV